MSSDMTVREIEIPVPLGHIAAKCYGNSTGRPVLAIHDWLDNAGSFDVLGPLLSDQLYVVSIDLPGHGASSHVPQGIGYHLLDFVSVLNRIVTHFEWKRVSILGHGVGAGLALMYAAVYSSERATHLHSVVLLNSVKPPSVQNEGGAPIIASAIEDLVNFEQNCSEKLTGSFEECVGFYRAEIGDRDSDEEIAKLLLVRGAVRDSENNWSLTRDPRLNIPDTLRLTHEQCFNLLGGVKTSLLIVKTPDSSNVGPEDQRIFQKVQQIYKETCKSFQVVEVDGSHYLHHSQAHAIVDTISKFLLEPSFRDYL